MSIHGSDTAIHIEVHDDGNGFDTDSKADGFGLVGMRERAGLVGGTLTVTSDGRGNLVTVVLPATRGLSAPGATSASSSA